MRGRAPLFILCLLVSLDSIADITAISPPGVVLRQMDTLIKEDSRATIVREMERRSGPVALSGRLHNPIALSGEVHLSTRPVEPPPPLRNRRWPANHLLRANVNNNPSFAYYAVFKGRDNRFYGAGCQATLVSRAGDSCLLATAAHCLDKFIETGQTQGRIELETADFGNVIATFKVPYEYAKKKHSLDNTAGDFDIATMEFRGPTCTNATQVRTIPIRKEPLYANTPVWWGSRWEQGLYCGVITPSNQWVLENNRWVTRAVNYMRDRMRMAITDRRLGHKGIKMGDSGGAVFTTNEANQLEFAGALARCVSAEGENKEGSYSTNDGLAWLRTIESNFQSQHGFADSALASNP